MQKNAFPALLCCVCIAVLFACQNQTTPAKTAALTATVQKFDKKYCVSDSICAEMAFTYPVLEGGDPAIAKILNDSIQRTVAGYAAWDTVFAMPPAAALEAGAEHMQRLFKEYSVEGGGSMSWSNELEVSIPYQSTKVLTTDYGGYVFLGGAHGSPLTDVRSYDLRTGRSIPLTAIVADTAALRPLLEAGFRKAKEFPPNEDLSQHLFSAPLAMPQSFGIVKEGLRVVYSVYEVSAYALGPTDMLLTWEDLGKLADKGKWVD